MSPWRPARIASEREPIVAVPARNEAERLPSLLAALAGQSWIAERGRALPVVIVLNNCDDGSRDVMQRGIAEQSNLALHVIEVDFPEKEAHVGSARRLAMETAFDLCADPEKSAILTTDADATPNPEWVAANLRHLGEGIDLVGGLIIGDPSEEARLGIDFNRRAGSHKRYGRELDRLVSLVHPLPHDPWPRHHDHTGASIAVRAEVYRAVGGMPALNYNEDHAFVENVRRAGFLIRHPLDVIVEVSARLVGRAPGGMADCLKRWMHEAAINEPLLVEHPGNALRRLHTEQHSRNREYPEGTNQPIAPRKIVIDQALEILTSMISDIEGGRHVT